MTIISMMKSWEDFPNISNGWLRRGDIPLGSSDEGMRLSPPLKTAPIGEASRTKAGSAGGARFSGRSAGLLLSTPFPYQMVHSGTILQEVTSCLHQRSSFGASRNCGMTIGMSHLRENPTITCTGSAGNGACLPVTLALCFSKCDAI